jgi:hypothetical protein
MTESDFPDIEDLQLSAASRQVPASTSREVVLARRQAVPFIKGPIPLLWLSRAASLGGKCLNVAMANRYLHGMSKGSTLALTTKALQSLAVSRQSGYRCLKKLEVAGLIKVDRKQGSLPRIKVLEVAE